MAARHGIGDAGPDGEVYVPSNYDTLSPAWPDEYRLGRATEWTGDDAGPVRGVGQRVFLVGDDAHSIMDIDESFCT